MKRTRRVAAAATADEQHQPRRPQPSHHADDAMSHTPSAADTMQVQLSSAASTTTSQAMGTDASASALTSTSHADGAAAASTTAAADSPPTSISSSEGNSLPVTRHLMRVRRSPRRACYIDGLASAEAQSIMQLLVRTSLLRLARCSRRLHSDADADLAWKHQPPVEVNLTLNNLDIGDRIRHSLVSHCLAVSVELKCHWTDALIDGLLDIPRITRLAFNGHTTITAERWTHVMRHEAMDGLRELIGVDTGLLPVEFLDPLVRLPHLHTLQLRGYLPRGDPFSALPQLAHLTSLQLNDDCAALSRLPAVAQCAGILDLRIRWPQFYGDDRFRAFFSSPHMRRLERLTLECLFVRGLNDPAMGWPAIPEVDFVSSFKSLSRLSHLCLDAVYGVDAMLPSLSHAPALTSLTIISHSWNPSTLASPAVLSDLLQQAPNLRVSLEGLDTDSRLQYAAHPRLSMAE